MPTHTWGTQDLVASGPLIEIQVSTVMPNHTEPYPWVTISEVKPHFPDLPWKVVQAKIRALIRRGLMGGCDAYHNCRGDWSITEKGRAYLAEQTITWREVDPLKVETFYEGDRLVAVRERTG